MPLGLKDEVELPISIANVKGANSVYIVPQSMRGLRVNSARVLTLVGHDCLVAEDMRDAIRQRWPQGFKEANGSN